jgi:hypothetical protein
MVPISWQIFREIGLVVTESVADEYMGLNKNAARITKIPRARINLLLGFIYKG